MNSLKFMQFFTVLQCIVFAVIMVIGLKVEIVDKVLVVMFGLVSFCGGASFMHIYKIEQEEKVRNNEKK